MIRIQRQRTKGWRMPEGAVYVGRPSRWGNPWKVGVPYPDSLYPTPMTAGQAQRSYRDWLTRMDQAYRAELLAPLRDATALACWCPFTDADGKPVPCHADVLIEMRAA